MIGWIVDIIKQSIEIIKEIKILITNNTSFQKIKDEPIINNIGEKKNETITQRKNFISEVETGVKYASLDVFKLTFRCLFLA